MSRRETRYVGQGFRRQRLPVMALFALAGLAWSFAADLLAERLAVIDDALADFGGDDQ